MALTLVMLQSSDPAARTAKLKDDPTQGGTSGFHFGRGDTLVIAIDTTSLPLGTVFKSVSFYPTADESVPMGSETWVRIDLPGYQHVHPELDSVGPQAAHPHHRHRVRAR